jgi:hypothetical protein
MSNDTGTISTKEFDFLDEDKSIRGQNYVLLSFLSPEQILVEKDSYYFSKFLNHFGKDMKTLFDGLRAKYPDSSEMIENIENNHKYLTDPIEMNEQYKFFKSTNSSEIEADYYRDNNFQTSIRGIKVRGTFDTIDEAKNRSEFLKKLDNKFDIFIGQVGCWCPWSPNPSDLKEQEFAESQLNTLMKKYKENMDNKDEVFEERKQSAFKSSSQSDNVDVSDLADEISKVDPWSERKENLSD